MSTTPTNFGLFSRVRAAASIVMRGTLSLAQLTKFIELGRSSVGGKDRPATPYSQVPAVHACVKALMEAMAMMPMRVATLDDKIVEDGPIVQLAEHPNPKQTGRAFMRDTVAFLTLFGRAFWRKTLDGNKQPVAMQVINPLQLRPKYDPISGELVAWIYRPMGRFSGREEQFPVEEIHAIIDPDYDNPDRPHDGIGPRQAVALAIAQYFKADLANEASLDNGCAVDGALKIPGNLTDPQRKDMREQIEERHAGVRNRRRMMMLEGGMEWQQIASAFSEMEFSELKKMSRTDICVGFGVPPAVIGYYEDSNYSHTEMAQEIFWTNRVIPMAEWIAEEWEHAVLRPFNGDGSVSVTMLPSKLAMNKAQRRGVPYTKAKARAATGSAHCVYFDASQIPAVVRAAFKVAESAKTWIDKGVPLNQVIRAFDLPFEEVKWGDTWWRPFGLVDVQEPADVINDPTGAADAGGQNGGGKTAQRDADHHHQRKVFSCGHVETCRCSAPKVEIKVDGLCSACEQAKSNGQREIDQATLERIWHAWRSSWTLIESRTKARVKAHFFELRAQVLRNLHNSPELAHDKSIAPDARRDAIATIVFDLVEANGKLLVKMRPLIKAAYTLGGEQAMDEAASATGSDTPKPFNAADPDVVAAMRQREIKVTKINQTLRKELTEQLADGLSKGETTDQLAERIRSEFNIAGNRASTIARTEVGAAVEEARQQGREQAGTPLKSWLWSRKETGRPNHMEMEHETLDAPIRNDAEFVLPKTHNHCLHPRSTGDPKDDINCGCTTIARYPGDGVKAVLERYISRGFITDRQLFGGELKTKDAAK